MCNIWLFIILLITPSLQVSEKNKMWCFYTPFLSTVANQPERKVIIVHNTYKLLGILKCMNSITELLKKIHITLRTLVVRFIFLIFLTFMCKFSLLCFQWPTGETSITLDSSVPQKNFRCYVSLDIAIKEESFS